MMRQLLSIACLCAAVQSPAWAQLADPTVPPAAARELPAAEGQPVLEAGMRLQSVLISPQRRVAVIDGVAVREGRTFKGGRLLKVSPSQVVVEKNGQRETLKLYPLPGDKDGPQHKQTRQD